jgi:hypothetical protein
MTFSLSSSESEIGSTRTLGTDDVGAAINAEEDSDRPGARAALAIGAEARTNTAQAFSPTICLKAIAKTNRLQIVSVVYVVVHVVMID